MIPEDQPSVVRIGSHTAICLGKKRKFWWLIPMSNKMLRLIKLTDKQMVSQGWVSMAYEVHDVAKKYLKHMAGVGPLARVWLEKLSVPQPTQLELEFDSDLIGDL